MKKKIISCMLALASVVSMANLAYADGEEVDVFYNGEKIEFDVEPIIEDGRALVPVRAIFEKIGAVVSWEPETRTVFSILGSDIVSLQINNTIMFVNDTKTELDVPARIVNDRTLVPLKAVSEAFDCSVEWDEGTRNITIKK